MTKYTKKSKPSYKTLKGSFCVIPYRHIFKANSSYRNILSLIPVCFHSFFHPGLICYALWPGEMKD